MEHLRNSWIFDQKTTVNKPVKSSQKHMRIYKSLLISSSYIFIILFYYSFDWYFLQTTLRDILIVLLNLANPEKFYAGDLGFDKFIKDPNGISIIVISSLEINYGTSSYDMLVQRYGIFADCTFVLSIMVVAYSIAIFVRKNPIRKIIFLSISIFVLNIMRALAIILWFDMIGVSEETQYVHDIPTFLMYAVIFSLGYLVLRDRNERKQKSTRLPFGDIKEDRWPA